MLDLTMNKIIESSREPTISEAEREVLGLLPALTTTAARISQWSEAIRRIQLDPDMSGDQKRKDIDELLAARNALFEDFLKGLPAEFRKERGIFE